VTIVLVLLAAYVVAFPAFAWTRHDLRRFPRNLWVGYGHPQQWREANVIAYALGGIPAFVVALAWHSSLVRREMRNAAHRVYPGQP
jgi:hypothetical protein